MNPFKVVWFGLLMEYHLRKRKKIDIKFRNVHQYHFEMAQLYYEKAFGKKGEMNVFYNKM